MTRYYYYSHFTEGEIDTERFSNMTKNIRSAGPVGILGSSIQIGLKEGVDVFKELMFTLWS